MGGSRRKRQIYEQKGYSEEWIEKRLRGIAVRDKLTDEWKKRGVKESREFAILTAEISKTTFAMTHSEYKAYKSLSNPGENLRELETASGAQVSTEQNFQELPERTKRKLKKAKK
jgi:hypothetical protein